MKCTADAAGIAAAETADSGELPGIENMEFALQKIQVAPVMEV